MRGCGGGSFRGSPKAPLDSAEAPREHSVYTLCTSLWYAFLDASSANQKKVMVPFSGENYFVPNRALLVSIACYMQTKARSCRRFV